jgi:predicted nuclease of restriction endonuclease-like RecB superfamily
LIPERLLQFEVAGSEALPRFLTPADHHWLRVLIEEAERFEGRRMDELRERLREPLPCYTPEGKLKVAVHVLERLCGKGRPSAPVSPLRARAALFSEAQRTRTSGDAWNRAKVVQATASTLGISEDALDRSLFADLPRERRVELPAPQTAPQDLALRANLALAQGFLQRSSRVSLTVRGNARSVVRQVRLRRLLCTVRPGEEGRNAAIEISGPYSLFRRTTLYGRALGSLIPVLRNCDRFLIEADAVLRGRELSVRMQSGDPIFPYAEHGQRYDSKLEERFSLVFRKLAPDFDLVREPEALRAGAHLIFPDFAIFRRTNPARRVLLEIVGFWTPEYLRKKLERLAAADVPNLLLCIDESLNCAEEALPGTYRVLRYTRSIDAGAVLSAVESMLGWGSE